MTPAQDFAATLDRTHIRFVASACQYLEDNFLEAANYGSREGRGQDERFCTSMKYRRVPRWFTQQDRSRNAWNISHKRSLLPAVETRWDENAGLRRDAIRSQVIDALEAQEIKETGNEEN